MSANECSKKLAGELEVGFHGIHDGDLKCYNREEDYVNSCIVASLKNER